MTIDSGVKHANRLYGQTPSIQQKSIAMSMKRTFLVPDKTKNALVQTQQLIFLKEPYFTVTTFRRLKEIKDNLLQKGRVAW